MSADNPIMKRMSAYEVLSTVEVPECGIRIIGMKESAQVPRLTGRATACYKSFVPETPLTDR